MDLAGSAPPLIATAILLALAVALPWTGARMRRGLVWLIVVAGVPTLGWLTFDWGPWVGVAGFALGALALCAHPRGAMALPIASQPPEAGP